MEGISQGPPCRLCAAYVSCVNAVCLVKTITFLKWCEGGDPPEPVHLIQQPIAFASGPLYLYKQQIGKG